MLSRKHYVAIASKVASKVHNYETRQALASELAVIFAEDNPRFDAEKFIEACCDPKNEAEKNQMLIVTDWLGATA